MWATYNFGRGRGGGAWTRWYIRGHGNRGRGSQNHPFFSSMINLIPTRSWRKIHTRRKEKGPLKSHVTDVE